MTSSKAQGRNVAVIAGAMGYVGRAVAQRLAQDGMSIAAFYRNSSEADVNAMLKGLSGDRHKAYRCDLQKAGEVEAAFASIKRDMGAPYACVYAAGHMPLPKPLHSLNESSLRAEFEATVFPAFNFLSAAARELKQSKDGVIIGITTVAVVTSVNTKARGAYSATKFAEQGMLTALREELAPAGVRVYSIAPGVMPGGLNKDTPNAFLDMVREKAAGKKLAEASDVADLASQLCSNKGRGMTDMTFLIAPESQAL